MTANSTIAECNVDGLYYPGSLFTDASSSRPGPTLHHSNDAQTFQIREVASVKQNPSETLTESQNGPPSFVASAKWSFSIWKMRYLRPFAFFSNYIFLLGALICLINDTTDDAVAMAGYRQFRKDCPSQRGGGFLVHVRNSIPVPLCQDPHLSCVQDATWLRADTGIKPPVGTIHQNYVLLLSETSAKSPTVRGPRVAAGYLNTPGIFWSALTSSCCMLPFVASIQQGGRIRHAAYLTSYFCDWINLRPHIHGRSHLWMRAPARQLHIHNTLSE